jgi:hypothetical protein
VARKETNAKRARVPRDVASVSRSLRQFLDTPAVERTDDKIGNSTCGVYAFYDYDGEPIYVGQTFEKLRSRIGRHLTNQRTDAVAMNVLDPFEVAEVEVWPLWQFQASGGSSKKAKDFLDAAEFTVLQQVLDKSAFNAVLNEGDIEPVDTVSLPQSYRARIVPDELHSRRSHPDIRIARRASTIANLARVISERNVSKGLRRTLLTQARRLQRLAEDRYEQVVAEDSNAGGDSRPPRST